MRPATMRTRPSDVEGFLLIFVFLLSFHFHLVDPHWCLYLLSYSMKSQILLFAASLVVLLVTVCALVFVSVL